MKVLTIAGTRPQLIKIAAVSRKLRKQFEEVLVNTGQHYDYNMAGVFFEELNIPKPDYDLEVGSASHGVQTGKMMIELEEVFDKEEPDLVLVYGDTNSTLAGALVAAKRLIPLIHVEAGLRSYNKNMPEEQNRILTDHISKHLFVPTKNAVNNLKKEGISNGIYTVGDVMMDAVLFNIKISESKYNLKQYNLKKKEYILGTVHRAENTNDPQKLKSILEAFASIDKKVYLPLHPRTKKLIQEYGFDSIIKDSKNIEVVAPLSYLEMLFLEKNAYAIVTDSGGVQKEAYILRVPCLTLRNQTEWIETIESGWNKLIDPLKRNLAFELKNITLGNAPNNAYGDGQAADKIVDILSKEYL